MMTMTQNGYSSARTVTPSDTEIQLFTGFMVGVTGAVAFQNKVGTTITLAAVPAYTIIPIATQRIMDTGTDAENIIGLN